MKGTVTLFLVVALSGFAPLSSAQTDPQNAMRAASASEPGPLPAPQQQVTQRADPADPVAANTRIAALVPAGMSTKDACVGFQSLGECSAALHASQNLNIPFPDVRGRMISGQSLGAAIQALKPTADSLKEVRRAEQQASEDLRPLG